MPTLQRGQEAEFRLASAGYVSVDATGGGIAEIAIPEGLPASPLRRIAGEVVTFDGLPAGALITVSCVQGVVGYAENAAAPSPGGAGAVTAASLAGTIEDAATTDPASLARIQSSVSDASDLRRWGAKADGSTDCYLPWHTAYTAGVRSFYLRPEPGDSGVAYWSNWDNARAQYCKFDFGACTQFSVPFADIVGDPMSAGVSFVTPVSLRLRSISANYQAGQNFQKSVGIYDGDESTMAAPNAFAFSGRSVPYPAGGNSWVAATTGVPALTTVYLSPAQDGQLYYCGAPGSVKPGDELSFQITESAGSPRFFFGARSQSGWDGVLADAGYGNAVLYKVTQRDSSAAVETALSVDTQSVPAYCVSGGMWTVRLDTWTQISIRCNGATVATLQLAGPAIDIGFGGIATGSGQTVRARDITIKSGGHAVAGRTARIVAVGDSRTADRQEAWPRLLQRMLDGSHGLRITSVRNIAVAGAASAAQRAALLAETLYPTDIVVIDIGTNDAQTQLSVPSFRTNLADMIAYAKAPGAQVLMGCMSPWYGQAQSGGGGQATTNADKIGAYRTAVARAAAEAGVGFVDGAAVSGPVLPHYVNAALNPNYTTVLDTAVYDSIHPTTRDNMLRAYAYACKIIGLICRRPTLTAAIHDISGYQNSWTYQSAGVKARATISSSGRVSLTGTLIPNGGPTTSGTTIFVLPRYLWPAAERRFFAASDLYASIPCLLVLGTDGAIKLYSGGTVGWVDISLITYDI